MFDPTDERPLGEVTEVAWGLDFRLDKAVRFVRESGRIVLFIPGTTAPAARFSTPGRRRRPRRVGARSALGLPHVRFVPETGPLPEPTSMVVNWSALRAEIERGEWHRPRRSGKDGFMTHGDGSFLADGVEDQRD